jgi:Asp-tRNA(Asn)/Glu-tRNA(Gln) amidotransferase A subunit family amidase
MVPLAIGSQTNGSVIRPAAFCGVYGCKPTHGTISRHGALILSHALDHVGVFARSLPDAALILEVLAGYDPQDNDTRPVAAPAFLETVVAEPPLPPRFAFVQTPIWDKADAETRATIEGLVGRLGTQAKTIKLGESFAAAWDDHSAIMAADMAHNLRPVVERGEAASSKALRDLLLEGAKIPAVRYFAARDAAKHYGDAIAEIFKEYDAIITPASVGVAPKGEATGSPIFCSLWTLTGLPALSLPLLKGEGGMPLGVQLIGERGDDARLLRTANWLINTLEN